VVATAGACEVSFDAINTTSQDQRLAVWVQVSAYLSGSAVGVAVFDGGTPESMSPQTLVIKAGDTYRMTMPITFGSKLRAGAQGDLRVYMGRADDPAYVDAYMVLGSYTVTADGMLKLAAAR